MIIDLKRKAWEIKKKADRRKADNETNEEKKDETRTILVVPHSKHVENISQQLSPEVKIVTSAGKKIGQIVKKKKSKKSNDDSVVYKIPCSKCDKAYYGETGRGLKTRIREHRNDLRNHRETKAIVIHADREGHLPDWNNAEALHSNLTKTERWLIEAAYIRTEEVTNVSQGFFKLHTSIAERVKKKVRNDR